MKKTKKKILGLICLASVIAITVLVAILPVPGASAVSDLTDVISVRVVGSVPNVDINGITNKEVFINEVPVFTINYENVETVKVVLKYTDMEGNEKTLVIDEREPDFYAGSETYKIHFVK